MVYPAPGFLSSDGAAASKEAGAGMKAGTVRRRARCLPLQQENHMLKFIGGTIGVIFIIGLLVVIGILALIF